ncbi:spore germination lipoprotein GerD [Sporolactobacillus sp. Y61]|uniref:Spore germination lipoprotein GerD n=1 Tax=Sporolactobacillus sp. Y61 TaxID=3160863 RepID=A0AAU8IGL2_9BACL
MIKKAVIVFSAIILIILSGCGEETSTYKDSKRMVLDMLRTDEGRDTLKEMLQDKELRSAVVMNDTTVKQTIIETLTTDEGHKVWQELLEDPDFSRKLAKTMEKENEQLLKKMMKDPDYQGMMIDILKDPELQKGYLELQKTKPFRKQMEKILQETVAGPMFQKELSDAITKVLQKQAEKAENAE